MGQTLKKTILLVLALVAFTAIGISSIVNREQKLEFQKVELQSKQAEIKQLQIDYQTLDKKQNEVDRTNQVEIERLNKEKEDLLKRETELERQLSAKREAQRIAATKLQLTSSVSASGCNTGNQYKDFIYMKESGCNPSAVNSIGCRGIGQACPGSKLPCGADFACQDAYFSNYAIQRYGSWEAAYSFWLRNSWW